MKIKKALISLSKKEPYALSLQQLHQMGIELFASGGTRHFIVSQLQLPCTDIETLTNYPSILGGRVKTLHPQIFGGILARKDNDADMRDIDTYQMHLFDMVVVDTYPFEQMLAHDKNNHEELIENIDIGGISLIRAAAKNFQYTCAISSAANLNYALEILTKNNQSIPLAERTFFAQQAFAYTANYEQHIANYFNHTSFPTLHQAPVTQLKYGENPHQEARFYGDLKKVLHQVQGKALSYNNLLDVQAALDCINEFSEPTALIIKHLNPCGVASRANISEALELALSSDIESAFGGIIVLNRKMNRAALEYLKNIFFDILIAPSYEQEVLDFFASKKNNRTILQSISDFPASSKTQSILGGILVQSLDTVGENTWDEEGARKCSEQEKKDLIFANKICKHLKSNAIAIVKNQQLIGKGCGQTSRVDALKQAIAKAKQFNFDLQGSVLASDAFFPFGDCVALAHHEGISAILEPGGSIRDEESILFCKAHDMALVLSHTRHFRH